MQSAEYAEWLIDQFQLIFHILLKCSSSLISFSLQIPLIYGQQLCDRVNTSYSIHNDHNDDDDDNGDKNNNNLIGI